MGRGGGGGQYMDVVVGVKVQDENSDNYNCDYYISIMSVVQFLLQRISVGKHISFLIMLLECILSVYCCLLLYCDSFIHVHFCLFVCYLCAAPMFSFKWNNEVLDLTIP